MPMTIEQLASEALALPNESRALLADRLVESLDDASDTTPGRLDELWAGEARRRLSEVRFGRVQTVSGEEAARRVRGAVGR